MARKRYIKPEFFKNEELAECSFQARLLFSGLWCWADKAGRLEYRPKRLRHEIFPYDDCDLPSLVAELERFGFVSVYEANGLKVLQVNKFKQNQRPHPDEAESVLPEMPCDFTASDAPEAQEQLNPTAKCALTLTSNSNSNSDSPPTPSIASSDSPSTNGTPQGRDKSRRGVLRASQIEIPDSLDTPEVRESLDAWLDHKRTIGKPYKHAESAARMFKQFATFGRDGPRVFCEAVDFSIGNNYQGLVIPNQNGKPKSNSPRIGPGQLFDPDAGQRDPNFGVL